MQNSGIKKYAVYLMPNYSNHFIACSKNEHRKFDLNNCDIFDGSVEWGSVTASRFSSSLRQPFAKTKKSGNHYPIAKSRR